MTLELKSALDDPLGIPSFLRREPGGSVPVVGAPSAAVAQTSPLDRLRELYPLTDRDRVVIAELTTASRVRAETKFKARIERVKKLREVGNHYVPGSRWDTSRARWVHPGLDAKINSAAPVQETVMAEKKDKTKKEPAAPRVIKGDVGKVADFKPVRAGTARAKVVKMGAGGDKSVAQIASAIDGDRKTVLTHLFCMNRDCAIGYEVTDDGKVVLTFPGSKTIDDAIKEPVEKKKAA